MSKITKVSRETSSLDLSLDAYWESKAELKTEEKELSPSIQRYTRHPLLDMKMLPSEAVTPAMVDAGRRAFKSSRRLIDDLWTAYDCDIDAAVRKIYRAMARAS